MDQQNMFSDGKNVTGDTWYVDNFIFDRRCGVCCQKADSRAPL